MGLGVQDLERPSIRLFDVGLEEYIGERGRSSGKHSIAHDSKAGTVLAIRDEELGVEGRYFPLGGLDRCLLVNTACTGWIVRMDVEKWART